MERKALLIETTEDTTRPDHARRAGLMELSVIASILGKLCLRDVMSIGASARRLGAAERVELGDADAVTSLGNPYRCVFVGP